MARTPEQKTGRNDSSGSSGCALCKVWVVRRICDIYWIIFADDEKLV